MTISKVVLAGAALAAALIAGPPARKELPLVRGVAGFEWETPAQEIKAAKVTGNAITTYSALHTALEVPDERKLWIAGVSVEKVDFHFFNNRFGGVSFIFDPADLARLRAGIESELPPGSQKRDAFNPGKAEWEGAGLRIELCELFEKWHGSIFYLPLSGLEQESGGLLQETAREGRAPAAEPALRFFRIYDRFMAALLLR